MGSNMGSKNGVQKWGPKYPPAVPNPITWVSEILAIDIDIEFPPPPPPQLKLDNMVLTELRQCYPI